MRTKFHAGLLACVLTMLLGGCSQKREQAADAEVSGSASDSAAAAPAAPAGSAAPTDAATQLESAVIVQPSGERRFIRTANVGFLVDDVYRSALAIEDLVAQYGGFVARNDIQSTVEDVEKRPSGDGKLVELATYTVRGRLLVRVPSERTQPFLRALATHVRFLDGRTYEAADAQFQVLRERLAQARHQSAQAALGDIAADGGKTGERVDAVSARSDAQAQRDEAQIARAELEDRIAFATIDLSMYQSPQVRRTERLDVDAVVRRDGPGFFARLGHALRTGWYGGLDAIVWLSLLWPLWLAVAACVIGVRFWRRRG